MQLTQNSVHIDTHHAFLRELANQGDTSVTRLPSEYQHADILTKVLLLNRFRRFYDDIAHYFFVL